MYAVYVNGVLFLRLKRQSSFVYSNVTSDFCQSLCFLSSLLSISIGNNNVKDWVILKCSNDLFSARIYCLVQCSPLVLDPFWLLSIFVAWQWLVDNYVVRQWLVDLLLFDSDRLICLCFSVIGWFVVVWKWFIDLFLFESDWFICFGSDWFCCCLIVIGWFVLVWQWLVDLLLFDSDWLICCLTVFICWLTLICLPSLDNGSCFVIWHWWVDL